MKTIMTHWRIINNVYIWQSIIWIEVGVGIVFIDIILEYNIFWIKKLKIDKNIEFK